MNGSKLVASFATPSSRSDKALDYTCDAFNGLPGSLMVSVHRSGEQRRFGVFEFREAAEVAVFLDQPPGFGQVVLW